MPISTSFLSGLSASAFAFAIAVGAFLPGLGVPLRFLAAGVAYSRVHTGVHYPGDAVVAVVMAAVATIGSPVVAVVGSPVVAVVGSPVVAVVGSPVVAVVSVVVICSGARKVNM